MEVLAAEMSEDSPAFGGSDSGCKTFRGFGAWLLADAPAITETKRPRSTACS
jgi:hypothetical protein